MKVHWTDEALSHLDNIYRYIAADAPVYALGMVDKITRRSQQIGAFPQSGRVVPEYQDQEQDIREVLEAPYRIKSEDQVDVLAVFHGAQRLPDDIDI